MMHYKLEYAILNHLLAQWFFCMTEQGSGPQIRTTKLIVSPQLN